MRLVLLTDTPRMGGAERILLELAGAAVAAGHETHIMTPQRWLAAVVERDLPAARAHVVGRDPYAPAATRADRGAALAVATPTFVHALQRLRPTVLHVSNGGFPGSELCRLAAVAGRIAGVPGRAMTVHAVPRPRSESHVRLQAMADRLTWNSLHATIGATEVVREVLVHERGMPPSLYERIPYGVEEPCGADDAAALRATLTADDQPLVVMVSASSDEQKGHHVLADAMARVGEVRAVVVGAPPPEPVRARVAAGLADRLIVAGRVPSVGPYLHAADAVVVPSTRDESLPLVVLEAMAAGVPVLASRLSGIPEAVVDGATGRLFPPGDAGALAELLEDLAADRLRYRHLGQQARQQWEERYSADAMTRSHLLLYDRLGERASR